MKKILISIYYLLATSLCYAGTVTMPTTYATGGTVTAANLNGNFNAVTSEMNGGLDNNNADTTNGYRFFETRASLPSAGSQGRTVFLTTDNTMNFDNGSTWSKAITSTGTPASGNVAVYTGSAWTLQQVWPVGSIYISTSSTNPATALGFGTWTAFGAGKVLVGLDSGDTDFDTSEETGGSKTHTLTVDEMPAHTHSQSTADGDGGAGATVWDSGSGTGSYPVTISTGSTGGGTAHTIVQPYVVVYMFKRTA